MGNFQGRQFLSGAIFLEGNCPGGNFPQGQLSGGSIIRGEIILGGNFPGEQLSGGQSSRGQLFRGNFPGAQFDENDHLYFQNAEAQESSQLSEIRLKIFNYFRKNLHLR